MCTPLALWTAACGCYLVIHASNPNLRRAHVRAGVRAAYNRFRLRTQQPAVKIRLHRRRQQLFVVCVIKSQHALVLFVVTSGHKRHARLFAHLYFFPSYVPILITWPLYQGVLVRQRSPERGLTLPHLLYFVWPYFNQIWPFIIIKKHLLATEMLLQNLKMVGYLTYRGRRVTLNFGGRENWSPFFSS